MGMPAIRHHWTTAEVRTLMDDPRPGPRYELIDGELIVTPAPAGPHQFAVAELMHLLRLYLDQEPIGRVLSSPADLELRPGTICQPDLFVVPVASVLSDNETIAWSGVTKLLLAVEIISPSSVRTDRVTKRDHYMNAGVPDYLVVDADTRMFEHWNIARDTPMAFLDGWSWQPRGAVHPLQIALPEFFDRVAANQRALIRQA